MVNFHRAPTLNADKELFDLTNRKLILEKQIANSQRPDAAFMGPRGNLGRFSREPGSELQLNLVGTTALKTELRDVEAGIARVLALREQLDLAEEKAKPKKQALDAPPLPKADADKVSDYQQLSAEANTLLATLRQQTDETDKLTQADRFRIQIEQAVAAGTKKLTEGERTNLAVMLDQASGLEKNIRLREAIKKSLQEGYDAGRKAQEQAEKEIQQINDNNTKLEEHIQEIGLTTEQLGRLKVARAEEAVAVEERNAALDLAAGYDEQWLINANLRIVALRKTVELTKQDTSATVAAEAAKKAADEFRRTEENIERGLSESIASGLMGGFEKGKSIAQNFLDTLKNTFKTAILMPIIQPIVRPFANAVAGAVQGVTGSFFGSAGSSAAGSAFGGNAGSLASFFGGAQTFADFGNFFGSIGATTEMGTTFGLMDALGGFAAAHPLAAAAIIGGGLLLGGGLFGDDGPAHPNPQIGLFGPGELPGYQAPAEYDNKFKFAGGFYDDGALQKLAAADALLNDATKYDPAELAKLTRSASGTMLTGGQDETTDQMLTRIMAYLEPARLSAEKQAAEVVQAQEDAAKAAEAAAQAQQDAANQLAQLTDQQASVAGSLRTAVQNLPRELGLTTLQKGIDALATSSYVAPLDRLTAARGIFDQTLASARAGDITAVNSLPNTVQSLLGIGRDVFASGPEFQALFMEANRALSDVLAQQQSVQIDVLSSVPLVIQEAANDQIAAIREQTVQLSAKFESLALEIRRLRAA